MATKQLALPEDYNVDCPHFEICEAPLCPLQERSKKYGLWYGDEEICKVRKFQTLFWVKKQKQIAKLGLTADDGFFTVEMLNSLRKITKGLKGADPNDYHSASKWLIQRAKRRP